MYKALLILMLLAVLALTACQASTPTPVGTADVEEVPAQQASTPTLLSRGTSTPTRPAESTQAGSAPVSEDSPGCVVSSPFPTPGPTEQSLFPPPAERDWMKGPESATVTFTEYSDFQ